MNIKFEHVDRWGETVLEYTGDKICTIEQAWDVSIAKWHELQREPVIDGGIRSCGLCMLYFRDDCDECPIRGYTGQVVCEGTPYEEWEEEMQDEYRDAELKAIAGREIEFLEKVRKWWEDGRGGG